MLAQEQEQEQQPRLGYGPGRIPFAQCCVTAQLHPPMRELYGHPYPSRRRAVHARQHQKLASKWCRESKPLFSDYMQPQQSRRKRLLVHCFVDARRTQPTHESKALWQVLLFSQHAHDLSVILLDRNAEHIWLLGTHDAFYT